MISDMISMYFQYWQSFFLGASLCIAWHKHSWCFIDTGSRNPYKLVCKVIKFATQHKNLICRSVFTYCEDELQDAWTWGKRSMEVPSQQNRLRMSRLFEGFCVFYLLLDQDAPFTMLWKFEASYQAVDLYTISISWLLSLVFWFTLASISRYQ